MKELIIGTGNPAKVAMVQSALKPYGIAVRAAGETGIAVSAPEEGESAQENARRKAIAYAAALGRAVLSIDNALYLDGLADDQQPGAHTRRVGARKGRATDVELLEHYAAVIAGLGGRAAGRWEFALCLAEPGGRVFEHTIVSPRLFVAIPCEQMIAGYPLESLQVDEGSGKYMAEMTAEEQEAFWQERIGRELGAFVERALEECAHGQNCA